MQNKKASIGLFDSGFGGLTVAKAIMELLPNEAISYYGDTARLPYGEKTRETITRYSIENCIYLLEKDCKAIVVACNTASAYAIQKLKKLFKVPIIGVIDPLLEELLAQPNIKRIGIIGTKGTIQSQVYKEKIHEKRPELFVLSKACPLFVPLVEENYLEQAATEMICEDYLKELIEAKIDTLVLACTHYPLLRPVLSRVLGPRVNIIDSARCCAVQLRALLESKDLLFPQYRENPPHGFFASDAEEDFLKKGKLFLSSNYERVNT